MQVALLLSVACATTTTLRADEGSPVEKVVKLLTDMQETLKKEEETDEEAYEKLSCWCETNDKGKTAAIEEYEAAVKDLGAEIERREKKAERLAGDIKKAGEEIATIKDSIEGAEAQRAKDMEKNHDEEVELNTNVESLKAAITVLEKHQGPQEGGIKKFQQGNSVADGRQSFGLSQRSLKLDFLSMTTKSNLRKPDDLDKLQAWMQTHDYEPLDQAKQKDIEKAVGGYLQTRDQPALGEYSSADLSALAKAKKLVNAFGFAQGGRGYVAAYKSQSGEIFGILTQLKEQLEADLKDVQDKEAKQAAESADLLANLKAQLAATEETLKDKERQSAENAKALVDAKENLKTTEENLDSDSKFLIELKALCSKADEEWEVRAHTRKQEIAAVSEALGMLTTDESKDLFSTTYSFVQLDVARKLRVKAATLLRQAGEKAKDKALLALSTQVQLDGFVKVKKAINDMIGALKQQQEDEVKHKDFCQAELQKNDMETMAKENEKADLEAKIDQLTNLIETLTSDIKAAKAAVVDFEVQQQRATEDRIGESKAFQQTVSDQRATQAILAKVLSRLNEFYTFAQVHQMHSLKAAEQAFLQQTPQEEAYKEKNVVPPVKFDEYKNSGGASPVLTLIGNLIVDAKNLEKESIKDENDATEAYHTFVATTNAARSAKEQEVIDKSESKATAEVDKEQAEADHTAAYAALEGLAKYKADLHSSCDFVLKNFDTRQTARSEEIQALQSALAILSGSMEA